LKKQWKVTWIKAIKEKMMGSLLENERNDSCSTDRRDSLKFKMINHSS
jgi:hypothetical protein